jgi:hypothetical protein
MIIPAVIEASTDAEYRILPVTGQKNAVTGFVGIDLQLFCESPDVAFDGARRQPHGLSNFRVTETHGQKIKDFGFPRGHVNRTVHSLRRRHGKSSSNFPFLGQVLLGGTGLFQVATCLPFVSAIIRATGRRLRPPGTSQREADRREVSRLEAAPETVPTAWLLDGGNGDLEYRDQPVSL